MCVCVFVIDFPATVNCSAITELVLPVQIAAITHANGGGESKLRLIGHTGNGFSTEGLWEKWERIDVLEVLMKRQNNSQLAHTFTQRHTHTHTEEVKEDEVTVGPMNRSDVPSRLCVSIGFSSLKNTAINSVSVFPASSLSANRLTV